jgi:hypothetical protein
MKLPQWGIVKTFGQYAERTHRAELQRLFNNGGYNNNNQGQRPGDNTILA